jgi:Protein of unknown function (DUF3108)
MIKLSYFSSLQALLFILAVCTSFGVADNGSGYRSVKNNKFAKGEKITYLVHYGFVNAGKSVVYLDKELYRVNNRVCYKVDITGQSTGFVSMMFKIDDLWRSYIDTGAMIPQRFYRNIQENSYRKVEDVSFDHLKKKAKLTHTTNKDAEVSKEYPIPMNVQDMVSGYYYMRTLDFSNIKAGDVIQIDGFLEGTVYDFKIRYLGKEVVKTKIGKIHAAVISPIMPENQLFSGKDALKVWISDDDNRVPLKIKASLKVGALEMDILEHEGLKYNFRKAD